MKTNIPLIAYNGDALSTPESTLDACWAALGAGATSLALSVHLSADGHVLCVPACTLQTKDGPIRVCEQSLATLQAIDAGHEYRSTELDPQGQPTGNRGADLPWQQKAADGRLKKRDALQFQTLEHLLYVFARRVPIYLILSECESDRLVDLTLDQLKRSGLDSRVTLIANEEQLTHLHKIDARAETCLDLRSDTLKTSTLSKKICAKRRQKTKFYLILLEQFLELSKCEQKELVKLSKKAGLRCLLGSRTMPYAPLSKCMGHTLKRKLPIAGYLSAGTLPGLQALRPKTTVFADSFAGTAIDTRFWRAGHSHTSRESRISVDEGLVIELLEGSEYAGAGAGLTTAIHGDFDAQVDFYVANPHQATTFELAAIGIDPGYHHMSEEGLNTRTVNLTFDVHGAPPYASSERDQNDGFRCGWNNCSNLTQVASDFTAASVNMYNKYGRDVGDGSNRNPQGQLRLVRHGAYFSTYYTTANNRAWINSGSMLVAALPSDCFVRLAAKHWAKLAPEPAPANRVVFSNFILRQH